MDPWAIEQNRVEFEHKGFKCVVLRGGLGQLNGYVAVPPDHPLYGKHKDDNRQAFSDISIHGGITYTDDREPLQDPDGLWWIGFDTAHGFDLTPTTIVVTPHLASFSEEMGATYKQYDYVREATEVLADQIAGMRAALPKGDGGPI